MIDITSHSGIYTLRSVQDLPIGLEEAWDFFSSPLNLEKITPKHMGFEITSKVDRKAHAGQIISYRVGILPGIKSNWVTEITHVEHQKYFVDEQRFGPYAMWHHEHWFEAIGSGQTRMTDKVSYKMPFGPLGHIAQALFVKRQLMRIFSYRTEVLDDLFS